jgi:phosphoglycerate dehydrogenase-like enzyme
MTRPPVPHHILIGGTTHAALADSLRTARPDFDVRSNTLNAIAASDLDWADTYVGFRRPPLPSMGNVRWVHCTGAGVDAWLYPTELPREILLTRTSEPFGPMIAEWALARAFTVTQHLLELARDQSEHRWHHRDVSFVRGTTAVVLGTGDVGSSVARAFRAMGCDVIGVSRSGTGDPAAFSSVSTIGDLAALAPRADWLIVTLPLTAETKGIVSRDVLLACRGAVLMNSGRGAVVDERAIVDALDTGALRAAALDVFDTEPLPSESPLWSDRRVMVSPHLSGPTTTEGALNGFLECAAALERGEWPARTVDRDRGY